MDTENKNAAQSPRGNWPRLFNTLWDDLLFHRSYTNLDLDRAIEEHKQQEDTAHSTTPKT